MENKKNKSIDNELSEASPNIISLTNSQAQVIYDQKGLDYISNLPFINKRDSGGNVVITGTVLPLTDEEQTKYNESIIVELNDRVYTNSSVNRALDTQFKYFKFPPKLTTRVVPTGSIDLPDLPVEDGLLFTGRILDVEGKLYYLEGSTYYEIAADSPRLGFPQKHLPALTFLLEKLEKPFLFRTKDDEFDSDTYPKFNPISKLGFVDGSKTMTYLNQKGELRRRDKYSGIIDIKSETYLSDPKFEDGGILGLADLADNNITDTVVEFNFDLIDEINPAPWNFGFLVDNEGTAFLNQTLLVEDLDLRDPAGSYTLIDQRPGLNRIGIYAENKPPANGQNPGSVFYEFKDAASRSFSHARGWRAQDASDGQYGNDKGFKPWGNTPVDEEMTPSRIVTNTYAEDGSYNKVYNTSHNFWLGNNQYGFGLARINAEYKWDNRGVRSAAVYRLGLNQDIGWSPKSNTNKRYGVVMVNSQLIIAVQTDNFILPNANEVGIVITLNYKSTATKIIRSRTPSKSWNGFNQIAIVIPGADVTEDLYQINVTQEEVPIVDPELEAKRAELAQLKSNLDAAEGRLKQAQTFNFDRINQQLTIINRRISAAEPRTLPAGPFNFVTFGDPELYNRLIQQRVPIQNQFDEADQELRDAQDARDEAQTNYDNAAEATSNYIKSYIEGRIQGNS